MRRDTVKVGDRKRWIERMEVRDISVLVCPGVILPSAQYSGVERNKLIPLKNQIS